MYAVVLFSYKVDEVETAPRSDQIRQETAPPPLDRRQLCLDMPSTDIKLLGFSVQYFVLYTPLTAHILPRLTCLLIFLGSDGRIRQRSVRRKTMYPLFEKNTLVSCEIDFFLIFLKTHICRHVGHFCCLCIESFVQPNDINMPSVCPD